MFVSQAAVGQQMKRLEDRLQVALFDRTQKTPKLNQLGKALIPKAREVVRMYDSMLDDLTGEAALIGELKLGAIASHIGGLIPLSIKRLIETYPKLHIQVVPGISEDLAEQVERGTLDAAVIAKQTDLGHNMQWQPFTQEELVLLTAAEVEEDDPVTLLKKMPYIQHNRRATVAKLANEWLRKNNISVTASMEMESLDVICSMVAHNLGISIVPNLCVADPLFSSLKKIPLSNQASPRIVGLVTQADCSKSLLVDKLLDELKSTVIISKSRQP